MKIHRPQAGVLVLDHLHCSLLLLLALTLLPLQIPFLQLLQPQPGQDKVHLDSNLYKRTTNKNPSLLTLLKVLDDRYQHDRNGKGHPGGKSESGPISEPLDESVRHDQVWRGTCS